MKFVLFLFLLFSFKNIMVAQLVSGNSKTMIYLVIAFVTSVILVGAVASYLFFGLLCGITFGNNMSKLTMTIVVKFPPAQMLFSLANGKGHSGI